MKKFILLIVALLFSMIARAEINIVAAENVYGNVAKQLGGPYVNVVSILNNPTQDPHLFSINPSTAKAALQAEIIIYNGADYDPWITTLLALKGKENRQIINVAELMQVKSGSNPHLWYLPETMPVFGKKLVLLLSQLDPAHQAYYHQQLKHFDQEYQHIIKTIQALRNDYKNRTIIATEPVFNYMAQSLGLTMKGMGFQQNVMNDMPPTISQIKQFEDDLEQHKVDVLIYNNQVSNPLTKRMLTIAEKEKIPIVGINEMMPPNTNYVKWML